MSPRWWPVVGWALLAGASALAQEVPQALAPWREWVQRGEEHRRCPVLLGGTFGDAEQHPCAWPGRLRLEVGVSAARFTVPWTVFADSWVPLPGGPGVWPAEVRSGGGPVPVLERGGVPHLRLPPGRHTLEGELRWQRRGESLPIPAGVALVELLLDGKAVFPVQRQGDAVWLGQAQPGAGEADALTLAVYRLLGDGVPATLETRLRLEVSGRPREEVLGPALPAGFAPVSLAGEVAALLEGDGRLRVQVRPGSWEVVLQARALAPLGEVIVPTGSNSWADEEVWSFRAAPALRVASLRGGRGVDPAQVRLPEAWRALPTVVVGPGEKLEVEERSRGIGAEHGVQLALQRQVWLDFEGPGATLRDRLSGRMEQGFRLDVAHPLVLTRATVAGEPVVVTRGARPDLTGVEVRRSYPEVEATSRREGGGWRLPVSGWQIPVEGAEVQLHLPPGRVLVAALGADSSPQAWVSRWTVLDVFLVLLAALLALRLLGRAGGGLALAFFVLSYHESSAPLLALLAVLAVALVRRALPAGRVGRRMGGLLLVTAGLALVVLVPFVAEQLRLALYPQLEKFQVGVGGPQYSPLVRQPGLVGGGGPRDEEGYDAAEVRVLPTPGAVAPAPAVRQEPEAVPTPGPVGEGRELLDKASALQRRYAAANVFQAGAGQPAWSWRLAVLTWSGPVLPTDTVGLLITPTWLTRLLRLLMVGILGALLAHLAAVLRPLIRVPGAAAALLALLPLLGSPAAVAQSTPDPALLEQLRERLLAPPPCAPDCATLAAAQVEVGAHSLTVRLAMHAEAAVAVPVPGAEAAWEVREVTVNGAPAAGTLRREGGAWWVPLPGRGVHRVELAGRLGAVDAVELHFPAPPQRLTVVGEGWEAVGVWEGRLRTDTLTLVRRRPTPGVAPAGGFAGRVPPFVRVTRELELDLEWSATTRVERVAPASGSLTARLPLLPGEAVLTPGVEVREGMVTVALGPGVEEATWRSRLEVAPALSLTAPPLEERSERWRFLVSPQWRAEFQGVPPSRPEEAAGVWVHQFDPLPGEVLEVRASRPEGVPGPTVAIDRVQLRSTVGRRVRENALDLTLRSTRGGNHTILLPADAEVLEVVLGGQLVHLLPQGGRLQVPVNPGSQQLWLRWREAGVTGVRSATPAVDLGASAANLELVLTPPGDRWVVGTAGPRVGPAVLYWWELAVMGVVALLLWRLAWAPLTFAQWLLLGLGFSTVSWTALAVVVLWLLALEARRRLTAVEPRWRFNLLQLGLAALTLVALGCLVAAVPSGLLGTPDLHVVGNNSTPTALRWFADRSDGPLPVAAAFTLPMGLYRLAMLAWALWLALAVVGWLRWGWACLTAGGGWRPRPAPAPSPSGGAPGGAAGTGGEE